MTRIDLTGLRAVLLIEEGSTLTRPVVIGADSRLVPVSSRAIAAALRAEKDVIDQLVLDNLGSQDCVAVVAFPVETTLAGDLR
jgi:hypothetical protein